MLDFGLGLRSLTPWSLSPDSGRGADAGCKGVQGGVRGGWPYYVPQTVLRRVVKMCSYFVPRLGDFEGHGIGLAEL